MILCFIQVEESGGQEMEAMVEEDKDELQPKMEDYDTELHVEEPGIVYCYIPVG